MVRKKIELDAYEAIPDNHNIIKLLGLYIRHGVEEVCRSVLVGYVDHCGIGPEYVYLVRRVHCRGDSSNRVHLVVLGAATII